MPSSLCWAACLPFALAGTTAAWAAPTPPIPDDPGEARPVRHWDLTDGHLRVTIDPATGAVLEGHVTWEVSPFGLSSDTLTLHGVGLAVSSAQVDGTEVPVRMGPDTLVLPVAPDTPHTVDIHWSATPERGLFGRAPVRGKQARGAVAWTQGEDEDHRHWFPGWDHPSDTFPLTTSVTVPDGAHAVANGLLVAQTPAAQRPGWTTWTYRIDQPIVTYLVALVAGDLAVETLDGPVPHEILRPSDVSAEDARVGTGDSPAMMRFFTDLLDEPYPYPVYRQALVPRFMYGGMENASLTILTSRYLADAAGGLDRYRADGLIAHELAHQWFGDLLTCHGWRELWLNEGFATHYAGRWAEHAEGEEAYAAKVLGWLDQAVRTGAPMASRAWAARDGFSGIYPRGAFTLHMLRQHLGTERFDRGIAAYVRAHRFSLVETADLRQAMEAEAGQDLRWFFDRWVHGWGAGTLKSHWSHVQGTLQVRIQQVAAEGQTPVRQPLVVWWGDGSGAVHETVTWIDAGTTVVSIPADDVAWVLPDPDGRVIAHWERTQPTAAWADTVRHAPGSLARLIAVRALADADHDPATAAEVLRAVLAGSHRHTPPVDPDRDRRPLAVEAAAALGARGDDLSLQALLGTLDTDHLQVRLAVVEALAGFPLSEAAESALRTVQAKDPELGIRAAALTSLGAVRPSSALGLARTVLARPDAERQGRQHEAAAEIVATHGAVADLSVLQGLTKDARRRVQHAATQAMVAIAGRADDPTVDRRVTAALVAQLHHEDIRTRQWIAVLLGELASPEAIPALQAALVTDDPAWAQSLHAALRASRAARPDASDPDALAQARAEIDRMKDALKAASDRIDALEARPWSLPSPIAEPAPSSSGEPEP